MSCEGGPEYALVLGVDVGVATAQLFDQLRRALDVGEEEGDGAGRKRGHQPEACLKVRREGELRPAAARTGPRSRRPRHGLAEDPRQLGPDAGVPVAEGPVAVER